MSNQEIARLFKAISAALEIRGVNKFKVIAYDQAAVAVEHATSELKDLWDDGKLMSVPGIGKSIASHLDELFKKGKVAHFSQLMKGLPPAMFDFLEIPGIGPKTAFKLCQNLGIKETKGALKKLKKAAKENKICSLEGFGKESQKRIFCAIESFEKRQTRENRMALPYAYNLVKELISYLQKNPEVIQVEPLGSLRRMVATIGDIDLAVATRGPEEVINWFIRYPQARRVVEKGPSGATIVLKNNRQVDLRVQEPAAFGSMLQYFTGSKHHNIRLREFALKKKLSLSEYGIRNLAQKVTLKKYETEEGFYRALGMEWIPPELREDQGEIEAAIRQAKGESGGLPKLVELEQIKGDLHVHSNFPIEESHDQGLDVMQKIIEVAAKLNYQYLGFAEHNPSQSRHSQEQIMNLIKRKKDAIEQLNYSGVHKLLKGIFNGLEIDIKPNGDLAIPESGMRYLDYGICSIHSRFNMTRKEMTKRVLAGLNHPKIKIFGHPTGRQLGEREGYELDWELIFDFCQKKDKWLEINAWPNRLDLPDTLVHEAVKNNVKIVISSDAHQKEQLELLFYGVSVARRGWAEKENVVNTLEYDKIVDELKGGEK